MRNFIRFFIFSIFCYLALSTYCFAEVVNFSGTGTKVTNLFSLETGLTIFNLEVSTTENYDSIDADLLDDKGNKIENVFNLSIDNVNSSTASQAIGIETTGTYILNIDTYKNTANWKITIESNADIQMISLPEIDFTLAGKGTKATDLFFLSEGLYVFNLDVTTTETYEYIDIDLLDNTGDKLKNVFIISFDNTRPSSASQAIRIDTNGYYILNIDASQNECDWKLSLNSPVQPDCYSEEQLNQAVLSERKRYDPSGDGKISIEEAIHALQIISGIRND